MPDEVVVVPGSVRYLVWLYAGDAAQPWLAALFATEHEIAASLRPGLEHAVAHARLAWWREEGERLLATQPRHPQTRILLQESRRTGRPVPDLLPLVEAAGWDLARAAPASRAELEWRCAVWARGLFGHLGDAAAAATAGVEGWLLQVGSVIEELRGLGALRADARRGRLRVPLEVLDGLGVPGTATAVLTAEPFAPALEDYLRAEHRRLRTALGAAMTSLAPKARPALRSALVWSTLAATGSLRAERALPAVRAPGRLDALHDNWSAWRAARRAVTGRPAASAGVAIAPDSRRDPL